LDREPFDWTTVGPKAERMSIEGDLTPTMYFAARNQLCEMIFREQWGPRIEGFELMAHPDQVDLRIVNALIDCEHAMGNVLQFHQDETLPEDSWCILDGKRLCLIYSEGA
jgi:hypothetical protein